jgi:hypothetical protein
MAFQQFPQKGGIPSGNTAGRPSGPVIGDTYYNGQLGLLEIYDGTNWVPSSSPAAIPTIAVTDVGTSRAFTSGAIAYTFTAGTNGGSPYGYTGIATIASSSYSATTTSTTVTIAVGNPGSYSATGTAYNGFGTSPANPAVTVAVTTVPEAPTIGTATADASTNAIAVTWTLNNSGGKNLSAITITPYLNGTTAQTSRTAATTSSTSYTFTDGQLTGSSAYTFKVKTTNANGDSLESAASNSATMPNKIAVDYLVIAGGAGGGCNSANGNQNTGGGGAGGYRTSAGTSGAGSAAESSLNLLGATNYSVVIGGGGSGGTGDGKGGQGGDSTFSTITSQGGGAGAGQNAGADNGGCGGGGSTGTTAGQTGATNQGRSGGNSGDYNSRGGGGGGTSTAGANGSSTAAGGNGTVSNITGTSVTRGGGGGGGQSNGSGATTPGAGGTGGGGSGPGGAGEVNTGSGGGGGYANNAGGAGGRGVVILRYPDTKTITIGAGLTGTESAASGGYKRATITAGSGNVSWS